jgi:hypothetical protein
MEIDFEKLPEEIQTQIIQAVAESREISVVRTGSGGRRNIAVVTPWPMRNSSSRRTPR